MKTPTINSRILKLEVLKDTATRASVNAVESRTTSLESDVATAQGDISTLQGDVATLTQGIADAVSTHNTATDSHADLRTAISDLMSNVEEVDADFVSISYNPSGAGASRGLYSGIMSETVPSQASTGLSTWVNQGAATAADIESVGLQVYHPSAASAGNICGLVAPVPATPYTLTALLEISTGSGNYPAALLGWADSGTKTHVVALCGDGRSGLIYANDYASWGFASSNAPMFTREVRKVWLRFADTGTAITVEWSHSGAYWHTLFSGPKSSGHLGATGYTRLFFGASNWGSSVASTLLSWSIS